MTHAKADVMLHTVLLRIVALAILGMPFAGCKEDRACPVFAPACASSQAAAEKLSAGCPVTCPCAVYCPPQPDSAVSDAAFAGDVPAFRRRGNVRRCDRCRG
ncbi:MAG: hypothetical protein ACRELB_22940 [Polyangiaceae bacterium]